MACIEKTRLAEEYKTATKLFAELVAELQSKLGTATKSDYKRLVAAVEDARVKSVQAGLLLKQHITGHGC